MISEKAAEAAARIGLRWDTPDHEDLVQNVKAGNCSDHMADRWRIATTSARAALQAALPVLLEGKAEEIARLLCRQHYADRGLSRPGIANVVESDWPGWVEKAEEVISILTGDER